MIIRKIEETKWNSINKKIITMGRTKPLMAQIELDVNYQGNPYILFLQLEKSKYEIVVLQALSYTLEEDKEENIYVDYVQILEANMLSTLLEILINQV